MAKRETLKAVITAANPDFPLLSERREIEVTGRFAQTLKALVEAGENGVTALDLSSWAVRLGHYIFVLRHKHGLNIETIDEQHGGDYPGRHGRYILRSQVRLLAGDGEEGKAA
jgi:hypothetical protein